MQRASHRYQCAARQLHASHPRVLTQPEGAYQCTVSREAGGAGPRLRSINRAVHGSNSGRAAVSRAQVFTAVRLLGLAVRAPRLVAAVRSRLAAVPHHLRDSTAHALEAVQE